MEALGDVFGIDLDVGDTSAPLEPARAAAPKKIDGAPLLNSSAAPAEFLPSPSSPMRSSVRSSPLTTLILTPYVAV